VDYGEEISPIVVYKIVGRTIKRNFKWVTRLYRSAREQTFCILCIIFIVFYLVLIHMMF
jgi:hypothetical protein